MPARPDAEKPWTANNFGFAKATEGLTWTDPTFEANWAALRQEGKFRGAYQFFHPELNADEQAEFFLSFVQGHGGLEPGDMLVVDSEVMAGPGEALQPGDPGNGALRNHVSLSGALVGARAAGTAMPTTARWQS